MVCILPQTQGKLSDAFVHCNKVENGDSDVDHIDEFDWCLCVVSTYKVSEKCLCSSALFFTHMHFFKENARYLVRT